MDFSATKLLIPVIVLVFGYMQLIKYTQNIQIENLVVPHILEVKYSEDNQKNERKEINLLYKKSENYTRNITENLPEEILIEQNILEKKSKNHKELSNQPYVIEETNSEKDKEKVFEDRQKIMKRGCKYLKYIEYLQNSPTTSFQELYNFHSFIHDINQPIEDKKYTKFIDGNCQIPILNNPGIRVIGKPFNIMICLPPKCGTSNWQRGMVILQKKVDGYEWKNKLYDILDTLDEKLFDKTNYHHENFIQLKNEAYKVANARNPFSRLYSAWHDKSRMFFFKNGTIDSDSIPPEFRENLQQTANNGQARNFKAIHRPYYLGIKPFEHQVPDGRNFSFEAFTEYIAANPGNSKMNHHWRTMTIQCNPCAMGYDYITHLEESSTESSFILKKLKVDKLTNIAGKYYWSPVMRDEENWSSIPRRTAENIYKHYFADFILFGYSPQDVTRYIEATKTTEWSEPELWKIEKSKNGLAKTKMKYYNEGNQDFICTKP